MAGEPGVRVRIDYGIYLLSRKCEEYSADNPDIKTTIISAIATTGNALMFAAAIMLLGILPPYFHSGLIFLADMGILLVAVMLINVL